MYGRMEREKCKGGKRKWEKKKEITKGDRSMRKRKTGNVQKIGLWGRKEEGGM